MRLYLLAAAVPVFLGSFLMLALEPMIGKMLLPRFGGTPAVWNTCMVFFQILLLFGYLWSHLVATRLSPRLQVVAQAAAVMLPLLFLPVALPAMPDDPRLLAEQPVRWLLQALGLGCGAVFFAVSTASPLLQSWYVRLAGERANPYPLYAAGNFGSLAALLLYPLVIEPRLDLGAQAEWWRAGYVALIAACCVVGALVFWRAKTAVAADPVSQPDEEEAFDQWSLGVRAAATEALEGAATPAGEGGHATVDEGLDEWLSGHGRDAREGGVLTGLKLQWLLLAALPSSLLLGVTTFMTTDIAAIPMLWVTPLALYLLSFVLVFARWSDAADRWVRRLLPFAVAGCLFLVFTEYRARLVWVIAGHLVGFFLVCLACHGLLARKRPEPARLTEFYLFLSLGGVLGGVFNTFVAPFLFPTVSEYPLVLALSVLAMAWSGGRPRLAGPLRQAVVAVAVAMAFAWVFAGMGALYWADGLEWIATSLEHLYTKDVTRGFFVYGVPLLLSLACLRRPVLHGAALAGIVLAVAVIDLDHNILERRRNFYGVLTIKADTASGLHMLVHGGILHGEQYPDDSDWRGVPLSYYHADGPLGQIIEVIKANREKPALAGIGLGVGSLAAYGDADTGVTFYEINPAVEKVARDPRLFTYLDDCVKRWCQLEVIIGDGRLKLAASESAYDLIVVDAFNSDAIPVHLITVEAMRTYAAHLRQGGILAYHISNRYVNLEPVLIEQAKALGLGYGLRTDTDDRETGKGASTWVIMAADYGLFEHITADERWRGLEASPGVGLWTDSYANVVSTLTWF